MGAFQELKKALESSADSGALNPYDLDPVLHEELLRLQPLAEVLDVIQAEGPTHEYRARTAHPQGWFEGESTPANYQAGSYERKTVALKIARIWGGVTGFAQKVNEKFVNTLAEELAASVEGMADVFEWGAMFGCANDIGFTGDAYQHSGMFPRVYMYAPANVIDFGGATVTLAGLDAALAKHAAYRQVKRDPALWFMGQSMKLKVDGLQSKVQLPLQSVELADGKITMAGYAGRGILESDMLVPAAATTSPTVDGAIAAGGSLPDGDWSYRIASVTMNGEQIGGTASATDTTATTNNSVDLTWTADANAKAYMIFRQAGGSGDYQLIDIIPAKTYDSAGTVNGSVEAYTDDGSLSAISQVIPLEAGEEIISVVNINPVRGLAFVGLIDEMGSQVKTLLSFVEMGRSRDAYDYFLKSYHASRLVYPNLVSIIRNVKAA